MDDSVLYTGVDGPFGNELVDEVVKEKISEQERLLAELTPQLQDIVDMIESEKALIIQFVTDVVDGIKTEEEVQAELKAAARYRKYLDNLKNLFVLKLNQTKGE